MKLLITFSLLLVAVCAAPKAGRLSVNRADTDVKNAIRAGMEPKAERFNDLLKEYIEFLRQQVNLPKRKIKKLGNIVVSILAGDDDFDDDVQALFEGDAGRLLKAFIQAMKQNRLEAIEKFFTEEYNKILVQILNCFGADGEDLPSVAAHTIQGIIRGFLKVFAVNLQGSESYAIAGAISGFGKTIATIFTDRARLVESLFKYFEDEVADLVKVILERFLGDDHTVYEYFVKVVKAIRSVEEEDNLKPPSGTRVAV